MASSSNGQIQDTDGHIIIQVPTEETSRVDTSGSEGDDAGHENVQPRSDEDSPSEIETQESIHDEEEPLVQEEEDPAGQVSFFGSIWNAFRSKFATHADAPTHADDDAHVEDGRIGPMDIEQGAASGSGREAPVCLICLEPLMPEDFSSGKAMSLDCGCRGDLALRHRECAVKWSQVKDDGRGGLPTCELCKMPVRNLPELPARPQENTTTDGDVTIEEVYLNDASQFQQFAPTRADIIFDCVRVTWIAMIVSILFFDASIGAALWTGLVAGAAYILMLRLLYKQHFEAMRAYAEQQARHTTIPVVHVV